MNIPLNGHLKTTATLGLFLSLIVILAVKVVVGVAWHEASSMPL